MMIKLTRIQLTMDLYQKKMICTKEASMMNELTSQLSLEMFLLVNIRQVNLQKI
jgi:hypothetical protein